MHSIERKQHATRSSAARSPAPSRKPELGNSREQVMEQNQLLTKPRARSSSRKGGRSKSKGTGSRSSNISPSAKYGYKVKENGGSRGKGGLNWFSLSLVTLLVVGVLYYYRTTTSKNYKGSSLTETVNIGGMLKSSGEQSTKVKEGTTDYEAAIRLLESKVTSLSKSLDSLGKNAEPAMSNRNIDELEKQLTDTLREMDEMRSGTAAEIASVKRTVKELEIQLAKSNTGGVGVSHSAVDDSQLERLEREVQSLKKDLYLEGSAEVDWAQASLGAAIILSQTTRGINRHRWWRRSFYTLSAYLRFERWITSQPFVSKGPRVLLGNVGTSSDAVPSRDLGTGVSGRRVGDCYAIPAVGNITIEFPHPVLVTSVGVDHVPGSISPFRGAEAPKSFNLYGVRHAPVITELGHGENLWQDSSALSVELPEATLADKKPIYLGTYHFDYPANGYQKFAVPKLGVEGFSSLAVGIRRLTFAFETNYGHSFTCVYRLRVHGSQATLSPEEGGSYVYVPHEVPQLPTNSGEGGPTVGVVASQVDRVEL